VSRSAGQCADGLRADFHHCRSPSCNHPSHARTGRRVGAPAIHRSRSTEVRSVTIPV
jgi:hypothetical protein